MKAQKFEVTILLNSNVKKLDPETLFHVVNNGLDLVDKRYNIQSVEGKE